MLLFSHGHAPVFCAFSSKMEGVQDTRSIVAVKKSPNFQGN